MSIVNIVVGVIVFFIRIIYLWCLAIVKAVVPAKFQGFKDVHGQVCLVTGAGSGLGRLMSQKFAGLGCKMVLWDINADGNEETATMLKSAGIPYVKTYTVDLSDRQNIYDVAAKVKEEVGDVDILINNAGIVTGKKFLDCPDPLIEKTFAVNTIAHFWTVKSFLPSMLTKNKGHIVSIASSAGFFGVSGLADYCASKFGAVGFNESLRNELNKMGKDGVHTTVVCPYYINTGMFAGVKSRIPILEPEFVVKKIVEAVLTNQEVLMVPKDIYMFYFLRGVLPINVSQLIGKVFGINNTMDDFVGRNKTQ